MSFKKEYRDLEMRVMQALKEKVNNSTYESKHMKEKAIEVSIDVFEELVIIDDVLIFLDADGLIYSVFLAPLEDLILYILEPEQA